MDEKWGIMKEKKILIIDDDMNLCEDIKEFFEGEIQCSHAQTTSQASLLIQSNDYDLIILDIEIGDDNGMSYYNVLREIYSGSVIFLSGINDVNMRIKSYKKGADDFLVKPFDLTELLLKVNKIIERYNPVKQYEIDGFKIDLDRLMISYQGQEITLQLKEYRLLLYFLQNQDIELSRNKLFKEVWNLDSDFTSRQIDVNVSKLRKRVPNIRIDTLRGKGYIFTIINKPENLH